MTNIQKCKCDPATWGHRVPDVCENYEPIMLSLDRIVNICDNCHHNEECHHELQKH